MVEKSQYKAKGIRFSQNLLTKRITIQIREEIRNHKKQTSYINNIDLLKLMLQNIGKGNTTAQAIRDGILILQHNHHLGGFYEEWHQKLHNNTTPDDIAIGEGLITFLKTNDINKYWEVLHKHGVTKERLLSFDRGIHHEPFYVNNPQLISDLEHFLITIKQVHSATDINVMIDQAKIRLFELNPELQQFQQQIHESGLQSDIKQLYRVTELRKKLQSKLKQFIYNDTPEESIYLLRDIIFLDVSLEFYLRGLVERNLHQLNTKQLLLEVLGIVVWNLEFSHPFVPMLHAIAYDYQKLSGEEKLIQALFIRIKQFIFGVSIELNEIFEERTETMAENLLGKKDFMKERMGEQVVRNMVVFVGAVLIKKLEAFLQEDNKMFEIISPLQQVQGKIIYQFALMDVQFKTYEEKTILIVENISGEEEVPNNVSGIIIINESNNYPDLLAHVSVRARNLKILLIACLNKQLQEKITNFQGKYVSIETMDNNLSINEIDKTSFEEQQKQAQQVPQTQVIQEIAISNINLSKYLLNSHEFTSSVVGAKSNNLERIRGKMPEWINLPSNCSIQFGVVEEILSLPENSKLQESLQTIVKQFESNQLDNPNNSDLLNQCQQLIMNLQFPQNEKGKNLNQALLEIGIEQSEVAWKKITSVFASKYNTRAYLAVKKRGINLSQIRMAVLIQKVIEAEYAFVLHTKNPQTNDENEIYGEVVCNLGEALVAGKYAGKALSFKCTKTKPYKLNVLTFASKILGLQSKGWIFRSDSNVEDLEGFAGAGLFDSFTEQDPIEKEIKYSNDKLTMDENFREQFLQKLVEIGVEVEKVFKGEAQDIEGCYVNGKYYVVQTRPQV
eukprot:TRINITY_DN5527_c0_g1_i9.p1 TRINITY_DN5527_c0_g1~~TRINITY_DN5527_c0_g1_i9.p1  ORF type:complete len:844 (-),score=166.05 TRINITY_DN5527_c0_g1_i9:182-2713(-)